MNGKRGDFTGIVFLVVMISAFAIFLLIVGYVTPIISTQLQSQIGISDEINNSFIASTNVAQNTLPTVWLVMFGGLLIALMITAYFIPSHPVFAIPFIILLGINFLISIALSNAYQTLIADPTFASTSGYQNMIVVMMTNLPLVSLVIGIIILVLSFAKPSFTEGGNNEIPV